MKAQSRFRWSLPPRGPVPLWTVLLAASAWMATVGNLPLWKHLADLQQAEGAGWILPLGMLLALTAGITALLAIFGWQRSFKPAVAVLLLATGLASYFMDAYGALMSPGMMLNVLQTDPAEARALAGPGLLWHLAWLAVLPAALVWRQRVDFGPLRRQLWRQPAWVVGSLAVLLLAVWAMFQPFSAAMRNHKDLRYLINPLAPLYSLARVATQGGQRAALPLQAIGEDAVPASPAGQRPKLLVLVVGETARASNFGINGYPRPTTPELEAAGALSFRNAWSCGTSTAESLPCMFAHLPRAEYVRSEARYQNLLDVVQHAGLAVVWVDNQGGCKGVCERVPHATVDAASAPGHCVDGACEDLGLLDGLDARIAALDPARRARGVLVVLHQIGNHGPAYFRRSPAAFKHYLPECSSEALQTCSVQSVRNAYDNAIAYTDHFLASTIDWLKSHGDRQDTALLYVSDHGESLGENNLYLHGMPYALAPEDQRHVPWITWLSPAMAQATATSIACLRNQSETRVSHDNYFHSVLGLLGITTGVYRPVLDAYAPCRRKDWEDSAGMAAGQYAGHAPSAGSTPPRRRVAASRTAAPAVPPGT